MHLGFNAIRFTRKFTGVGRYMECLLREWSEMDMPFDRITLYTHTPFEQDKLAFPLDRYEVKVIGRRLPDPVWETTTLGPAASDDGVDVLFSPSYSLPIGVRGKCVVTNLGPPENERFTYAWMRQNVYEAIYVASAHRADRVLACSKSVKERMVDLYRIPAEKVRVTYLAASDVFKPVGPSAERSAILERYQIPEKQPFILFVGKMARRHYIPNLIRAFADLKNDGSIPHRLVLVGPDYLGLGIMDIARELGVQESVTHVEYAVHRDLPAIYSAAELFVFPASWAEGFGIPVVEAMACGTPVITVNQGSLREVAPGAAWTTETAEADDLHAAMFRMIKEPELRDSMIEPGFERAKKFSWRITAEKTMETLADVAQS